jgi:polysaccharide export outer membrane protein
MHRSSFCSVLAILASAGVLLLPGAPAAAQETASAPAASHPSSAAPVSAPPFGVAVPNDYVIGPEDVLGILFWREQDMSGDVTVRPDGRITLPLLGDVAAAGLRPEALKEELEKAAARFLTEPNATVVVREIKSRTVFITGEVATPGPYPLTGPLTIMQLIALAGGLNEYADSNNITVIRMEGARQRSFKFRYKDVARGMSLPQNLLLQPGDTVVVP